MTDADWWWSVALLGLVLSQVLIVRQRCMPEVDAARNAGAAGAGSNGLVAARKRQCLIRQSLKPRDIGIKREP